MNLAGREDERRVAAKADSFLFGIFEASDGFTGAEALEQADGLKKLEVPGLLAEFDRDFGAVVFGDGFGCRCGDRFVDWRLYIRTFRPALGGHSRSTSFLCFVETTSWLKLFIVQ